MPNLPNTATDTEATTHLPGERLGRRRRGAKVPGENHVATLVEVPVAQPVTGEDLEKPEKKKRGRPVKQAADNPIMGPSGEDAPLIAQDVAAVPPVKRKRRTKAEMQRDRLAEEAARLEKDSKKAEALKRVANLEAQMAQVDAQAVQPRRLRQTSGHPVIPLIALSDTAMVESVGDDATEPRGRSESVVEDETSGGETTDIERAHTRPKKKARIPIRQSIDVLKEQLFGIEEEKGELSDLSEDENEKTPRGKQPNARLTTISEAGKTVLDNNASGTVPQKVSSERSDGASNPRLAPMCVVPFCLTFDNKF